MRRAEADRLPDAWRSRPRRSSVRDQFLPGYRADSFSIGVQGHWTVFSSGGRLREDRRGASGRTGSGSGARPGARRRLTRALSTPGPPASRPRPRPPPSSDQARAADAALADVREEVRVGERPTLDLLDAERADLDARIASLDADAARVVAAYKLDAVMGGAQ